MGTGLKAFQDRLRGLPVLVREELGRGAVEAAEEVAETIRQLAPVDEGDLRASVVVTGPGQSTPAHSYPGGSLLVPDNGAAVTAGNSDVRYPHLVEFGTVDTPAQPFFGPGYRLSKTAAAKKIKAAIKRAVGGQA